MARAPRGYLSGYRMAVSMRPTQSGQCRWAVFTSAFASVAVTSTTQVAAGGRRP